MKKRMLTSKSSVPIFYYYCFFVFSLSERRKCGCRSSFLFVRWRGGAVLSIPFGTSLTFVHGRSRVRGFRFRFVDDVILYLFDLMNSLVIDLIIQSVHYRKSIVMTELDICIHSLLLQNDPIIYYGFKAKTAKTANFT